MKQIPIEDIEPSTTNLRQDLGKLEDLMDSIKNVGVVQPLILRPSKNAGKYELVIGKRRYEACRLLKLKTVPCVIIEVDDREAVKQGVIDNAHTKNNEWYEYAEACKILRGELVEQKGAMKKYEKTTEEISKETGLDVSTIKNYILADEVAEHSRVRSALVKDYSTFRMIHAIPKKEWKDAVDYVMKNDTSRADFDKKIDSAEKVKQRIEFLEITHPDIAKIIRDFWWKYKFENIYKDMCDEINIRIGQPTSKYENIDVDEMTNEEAVQYAKEHSGEYMGRITLDYHRFYILPKSWKELRAKWEKQ